LAFIGGGLLGVVLIDDVSFTTLICSVVLAYSALALVFLVIDDGKEERQESLEAARRAHPASTEGLLPLTTP
jgi:hypothetical protein